MQDVVSRDHQLVEADFPRAVQVRDDRGWHDGFVRAARRDQVTGRWRGYVDYVDHSDLRTGGHYIQWADEDRIRARPS